MIVDFSGTEIITDFDNGIALKVSRDFAEVHSPNINNIHSHSGITGIALVPESETQTTTRTSQQFCKIFNPKVKGCSVGVRFRPGPTVGGQSSGAYYTMIYNPWFYDCNIGFHFARSVSGDNLITRTYIFAPVHLHGHCAWDIEAADSLNVFGGSCEFINQKLKIS